MTRYFAYGANMDPHHMAERCPTAKRLGFATLAEHRFGIAARGYGDAVPAPGRTIPGVLWSLEPADEAALDAFEGVPDGWYRKQTALVRDHEGRTVEAMLYRAADPGPATPAAGYLEGIIASAEAFGFPAGYVAELRLLEAREPGS